MHQDTPATIPVFFLSLLRLSESWPVFQAVRENKDGWLSCYYTTGLEQIDGSLLFAQSSFIAVETKFLSKLLPADLHAKTPLSPLPESLHCSLPCPCHPGFLPSVWPHVIPDSGKWPNALTPQCSYHLHRTLMFDNSRAHFRTWHIWSYYTVFLLSNLNVFPVFPWNQRFLRGSLPTMLLKVDALK